MSNGTRTDEAVELVWKQTRRDLRTALAVVYPLRARVLAAGATMAVTVAVLLVDPYTTSPGTLEVVLPAVPGALIATAMLAAPRCVALLLWHLDRAQRSPETLRVDSTGVTSTPRSFPGRSFSVAWPSVRRAAERDGRLVLMTGNALRAVVLVVPLYLMAPADRTTVRELAARPEPADATDVLRRSEV